MFIVPLADITIMTSRYIALLKECAAFNFYGL